MSGEILQGDIREVAKGLPDQSVNCIVTSPPYYLLRDYGIDKQLGLEESPEAYVKNLVGVFRELRRVLHDSGTVWLNLGDSYFSSGQQHTGRNDKGQSQRNRDRGWKEYDIKKSKISMAYHDTLKPKDLIGIPWRVAFALQADGWYLRSDIIWHKLNSMPESVTDRPTKAHEFVFLLSKKAKYWFDQEAIRECGSGKKPGNKVYKYDGLKGHETKQGILKQSNIPQMIRNARTVWSIATKPYSGAHFAVMPESLAEKCILAGCPSRVCECGEPWVRVIEKSTKLTRPIPDKPKHKDGFDTEHRTKSGLVGRPITSVKTLNFAPTCQCSAGPYRPGIVLDPFFGAGTVAKVAIQNNRNWLGVELNPEYVKLAKKRIAETQPILPFSDL